MKVRPLRKLRDPRYPRAHVVRADPRVFITTKKTALRRFGPWVALLGGTAALGTTAWWTLTPGVPPGGVVMGDMCPAPAFTEAQATAIVTDEMAQAGYRLHPATGPVHGINADAVDDDILLEWFDRYDSTPGDLTLDDAVINGDPYLRLPEDPADELSPDGPYVGIFDGITEEELRQQVRDFIEWLEANQ